MYNIRHERFKHVLLSEIKGILSETKGLYDNFPCVYICIEL